MRTPRTPQNPVPARRRAPWRALASACLLSAVVACQQTSPNTIQPGLSQIDPSKVGLTGRPLRDTALGKAMIEGSATGPAGLVGANIISNNGVGIISNHGAGIISGNSSRYRVAAVSEEPVQNALVYLTDPEERFFAKNGQPIAAYTDAAGKYAFSSGLPSDQVVIVNVMLADNRREVGYTVSKAGKNTINVSLATTYVTEFLRERAAKIGKKMGDYDLSKLAELTRLTQKALDAGELALPELAIGKIAEMNQVYAIAVGLNKQGLGDAWASLLGQRVLAVTTFAGTGEAGNGGNGKKATEATFFTPKGVTRDANGNTYIVDEGNHVIRKVDAAGLVSTVAGLGIARFSGDGGPAKDAGLWWPRTLLAGPNNMLWVADTLNMRIRKIDLTTGTIETAAGNPDQANGSYLNDFAGDGGPATQAKLAGVRGMTWGKDGSLIFSDTWSNASGSWNHIRQIAPDGTISTLVGVDGKQEFNGDGKPGRETAINFASQLAVDPDGNVIFTDAYNYRVRKYDMKTKLVSTIAGNGTDGTAGDGGKATEAQLSLPYGVTVDSQGRVYIAERGSRRIRVVFKDGTIRTLAGGGKFTGEGEALSIALSEPHDLMIEPDGNLLVCDSRAARVRRLWLKWGM